VLRAAADVVNLARARVLVKRMDEPGHVDRMNIVADLFALVSVDPVQAAFDIAPDEMAEKAVKFNSTVVRSGEAPSAQAACLHPEITTVLLDHDIGGDFRCAENAMFAVIDREVLADPKGKSGVSVFPTGDRLLQRNAVGSVSVHF